MKKIIAILLTLASSMTLFACSKANTGTVIMYGDMEIRIDDAECQILVSGTLNEVGYYMLPSQIYPTDSALFDELSRLSKERNERRIEKIKTMYPPQPSMSYTGSDGKNVTMEFKNSFMIGSDPVYVYGGGNSDMYFYADTGALWSYSTYGNRTPTNDSPIVSSKEEAAEYALDYAKNVLNVYKLDEYRLTRVQAHQPSSESRLYTVTFQRHYKGVFTAILDIQINDHYGVKHCSSGCDKKRLDFKDSCIDYALARMSDEKVLTALQSAAAAKPEVAEIKNVKLRHIKSVERTYDYPKIGESIAEYSYEKTGSIGYSDAVDKTDVYFIYDYTVVMTDGSEMKGCNAISVFLPIDWAEVYREK